MQHSGHDCAGDLDPSLFVDGRDEVESLRVPNPEPCRMRPTCDEGPRRSRVAATAARWRVRSMPMTAAGALVNQQRGDGERECGSGRVVGGAREKQKAAAIRRRGVRRGAALVDYEEDVGIYGVEAGGDGGVVRGIHSRAILWKLSSPWRGRADERVSRWESMSTGGMTSEDAPSIHDARRIKDEAGFSCSVICGGCPVRIEDALMPLTRGFHPCSRWKSKSWPQEVPRKASGRMAIERRGQGRRVARCHVLVCVAGKRNQIDGVGNRGHVLSISRRV